MLQSWLQAPVSPAVHPLCSLDDSIPRIGPERPCSSNDSPQKPVSNVKNNSNNVNQRLHEELDDAGKAAVVYIQVRVCVASTVDVAVLRVIHCNNQLTLVAGFQGSDLQA